MNLANLKPSFSELSKEDQLKLILSIRESRRTPKKAQAEKPEKEKATRRASAKKQPSAEAILSAMSPDAIAKLLAQLKEKTLR